MMRSVRLLPILGLVLFTSILTAGEPPAVHLTGNPSVDLFSPAPLSAVLSGGRDVSMFQDPSAEPEDDGRKSPALAGLMSLLVPGTGEFYTKSYLKGAAFLAAEAACWTVVLVYNKKGRDQEAMYKAYADQHYSAFRYAVWLRNFIHDHNLPGDYSELFQGSTAAGTKPPFTNVNWVVLNRLEAELGQDTTGFSHQLPFYGEQQYYELIGKYVEFIRGWDNEDPANTNLPLPEVDRYRNQQFLSYGEMFNQADRYYNIATSFVDVVVANHILSALDAIWSASRYNNMLHAEVHMNLEQTPMGYVPVTRARVEYRF